MSHIMEREWQAYRDATRGWLVSSETDEMLRCAFYAGASASLAALVQGEIDATITDGMADELAAFIDDYRARLA